MLVELNSKNQEILIDLLLDRINQVKKELKSLPERDKLEKIRLNKELENTLKTLKKFEVK